MISNNLSWNENRNRRALGAFFQIKRSLSQKCGFITKLNAYTGYVEPILTLASQRLPNKTKSATLEKVQKLATRWILGPTSTTPSFERNTMRQTHVHGDSYADAETATSLKNYDQNKSRTI